MIFFVIILLIVFLVLWIVFIPVNLRINSADGLYELKQAGTLVISLQPNEAHWFKIRVFGFLIDTQLKPRTSEDVVRRKGPKKHGRVPIKSFHAWQEFGRRVVNSFQCKRFVCCIDFDDVVMNAQLYPVGRWFSHGNVVLDVNFEKKYLLDLWIQFRLYKIVWAFARFYLTK